jgi:IstB-like ATP binding protein
MTHHPDTRAYAARRTVEGRTTREIKRCLKRYLARQLYRRLQAHPNSHQFPLPAGLDSHRSILATAIAIRACLAGHRVAFATLAGLANELQEAESRRELARVVGRYSRNELVVLDELGYLALPEGAAELVFQVISERNERGSVIVTTNLPFGEWTKVFPDPCLAKAVVDRLTHKAHIIDTGTESWRFRHGLARTTKRRG